MPMYVMLVNWTEQGVRDAKHTVERSEQVSRLAEQLGARIGPLFWTMGRYDLIGVLEAPDDGAATALALRIGGAGHARTETLRAFTAEEMAAILNNLE